MLRIEEMHCTCMTAEVRVTTAEDKRRITTIAPMNALKSLFASLLCLTGFCLVCSSPAYSQKAAPYAPVNSEDDDYAISFRSVGTTTEAWFTTSSGMPDKRSRHMMILSSSSGSGKAATAAAAPVNVEEGQKLPLNGCASFSACNPNYGVMISNRPVNGKTRGNDLYEIQYDTKGWTATRLDALCSDAWDDTPCLSPDGALLYFASDRNSPYSRNTDIFVSTRNGNSWSTPELVKQISTAAHSEQTPYAARDGYLYYASNQTKNGDYDVWRARYDAKSGQIISSPEPVPFEGVNAEDSDEGHPCFSPGGSWFFFSSNRSEKRDYDIYSIKTAASSDTLAIRVMQRSRQFDRQTNAPEDIVQAFAMGNVQIQDLATRKALQMSTNAAGELMVVSNKDVRDPLFDMSLHTLAIEAQVSDKRFISSRDTVIYDGFCQAKKEHTLMVWDTAAYYIPECVQDFPVKNVRFFVTGYWCPTTEAYTRYLNCSCIIACDTCNKIDDAKQPSLNCGPDDELYRYSLVKARVDVARKEGSACINTHEAKSKGHEYAMEVDSAIVRIAESMRSALQIACIQREVAKGKKVTVQITGWTDPRPLDESCTFTGKTIDFSKNFVKLNMDDSPYIVGDSLPGNGKVRFSRSKAGGNYLLSQLRAYYTAIMFDKIWDESVSEYREMKSHGNLEVVALGKAVSQENRDFSERRSVEIRVTVPISEKEMVRGVIPDPGQRVILCDTPCK